MKQLLFILLVQSICNANIYDGNTDAISSPRDLSLNSIEIGGLYTDALTTSIKNHYLLNVSGEDRLWTFTATSQLVLENSTLDLDGTYTFSHGSILVVGNCVINGSSDFNKFRYQGGLIHIAECSELRIGNGVNFEYAPTGSTSTGIRFGDSSSKLTLEDATLTVSNTEGLNLIGGNLRIEGNSTVDNFFTKDTVAYLDRKVSYTETSLVLGNGSGSYGDCKLKITAGSTLNVKNAGIIYKNNGVGSFKGNNGNLIIDKNSIFLDYSDIDFGTSGINIKSGELKSESKLGDFSGLSFLDSTVYLEVNATYGVYTLEWSPSDKYLAVGGHGSNAPYNVSVEVFSFDSYSLSASPLFRNVTSTGATWDNIVYTSWSSDGKYLGTIGYTYNTSQFRVLCFEESSLTSMATTAGLALSSSNGSSCSWSPNGKFVVITGSSLVGKEIRVFRFDGTNLILVDENEYYIESDEGQSPACVRWSPNGKYIVVSGNTSSTNQVELYSFNGSSMSLLNRFDFFSSGDSVAEIRWSPDGKYLVAVGDTGELNQIQIYRFENNSLISIGNWDYYQTGDRANCCAWSPGGEYLAVVGSTASLSQIEIFKFTGTSLNSLGSYDYKFDSDGVAFCSWSHNGKFLAVCGNSSSGDEIVIYRVDYLSDGSKDTILKDATIKLNKDLTLRNINLKMK